MTSHDMIRAVLRDKMAVIGFFIVAVFIFTAILGPVIAPYDPQEMTRDPSTGAVDALEPPSSDHYFGTTNLGRDVFSQVVIGARTALTIGAIAGLVGVSIATILGLLAGYFGGWADSLITRAVEFSYTIPAEPLAVIILSVLGPSFTTIVLAISILAWRQPTRVVRNQVLTLRNRQFLKAAKVSGASHTRILFQHIAPLTLPVALVYFPVEFGSAIIAESVISFLGFGDPASSSWGVILRRSFQEGALQTAWWWMFAAGAAITLATAALYFSVRPLEELVNPKLRARR
jgi:peptide/nickel transport system permease protein